MSIQTIKTDLIDLSLEEQELLSGGRKQGNGENGGGNGGGTIRINDAVFNYGGKEYPAEIFVRVQDLPTPDSSSEEEEEEEENGE